MKTLYNECVNCGEKWQVVGPESHLGWDDIKLDETDKHNLDNYDRLYSICEDCSESGEVKSVEKEEE